MKQFRKRQQILIIGLCSLILLVQQVNAQTLSADPRYKLLASENYVQSKNYYLLTLFEEVKEVRSLLLADPVLAGIRKAKADSITTSLKDCGQNALCYTNKLLFSKNEIEQVSQVLRSLFRSSDLLSKLVADHLKPSGTYILYSLMSPEDMLVRAWEQDANGLNFTIGVYAQGKKANYPAIDSISFQVNDPRYGVLMHTAVYELNEANKNTDLFFEPSLRAALRFLEYNERNNAGEYEPMTESVNSAAVKKIKSIQFKNYPYSLIHVPGMGPDEKETVLSAEAMMRMRIAVHQYKRGMAPLILVSGGRVHPYKTKYNEAIEMKKFLIENMHIPDDAILVDPHARHTTTNMRNTARIVFRYGIPFDKPVLTSTSRGQSMMIEKTLAARCKADLGMIPFRVGKRLSESEVEIFPLIEALQIDPEEPMDP